MARKKSAGKKSAGKKSAGKKSASKKSASKKSGPGFDTGNIDLVSYDCDTHTAVIDVTGASGHVAVYGWDKASTPTILPHQDSQVVAAVNGQMTISDVPHEGGSCDIQLQIWGVDLFVNSLFDCCSSSSSSSSSSASSEPARESPVLP